MLKPAIVLTMQTRHVEPRDAVIGYDATGRLLFVMHIELAGETIRRISARRATNEERRAHEHS